MLANVGQCLITSGLWAVELWEKRLWHYCFYYKCGFLCSSNGSKQQSDGAGVGVGVGVPGHPVTALVLWMVTRWKKKCGGAGGNHQDDGYRRSGVSSRRGECPDPRETETIQCSKCLLYIIYHQCLLQLYNINVHCSTVCHCVPKQQWQYTNCSMTVFIFPFWHAWICECLILCFLMLADVMLICPDLFGIIPYIKMLHSLFKQQIKLLTEI